MFDHKQTLIPSGLYGTLYNIFIIFKYMNCCLHKEGEKHDRFLLDFR